MVTIGTAPIKVLHYHYYYYLVPKSTECYRDVKLILYIIIIIKSQTQSKVLSLNHQDLDRFDSKTGNHTATIAFCRRFSTRRV